MASSQRILGAVYEEFQPKLELRETQLQIDQVKIRYTSPTSSLSISGEEPEGGNKWSRFGEAIPVPENCDVNRLCGQFDGGDAKDKRSIASLPSLTQKGKEELVPKHTRLTLIDEQAAPRTARVEGKRVEYLVNIIGKGIQEVAASASSSIPNIGDGRLNNEEKHLLAVVISALGAHLSYRSTGSGKPYNY